MAENPIEDYEDEAIPIENMYEWEEWLDWVENNKKEETNAKNLLPK